MKLTITNGAILNTISAINKFSGVATGKTSYAMYRTLRKLQEEIKDYEKVCNSLIMKYGKEIENGSYAIPADDTEANKAFLDELLPIYNTGIEVEVHQVDEEDFDLPECKDATVNDYMLLETVLIKRKDEAEKEA